MGRLCWFANGSRDQESVFEAGSRDTAGMNKPWRVFLQSGYKQSGVYECRITIIWASRLQVKLHEVYLKLLERSGFVRFHKAVKKAGTICKNRDKQMTYIVRVRRRCVL